VQCTPAVLRAGGVQVELDQQLQGLIGHGLHVDRHTARHTGHMREAMNDAGGCAFGCKPSMGCMLTDTQPGTQVTCVKQ
jgi:hypothetical protein